MQQGPAYPLPPNFESALLNAHVVLSKHPVAHSVHWPDDDQSVEEYAHLTTSPWMMSAPDDMTSQWSYDMTSRWERKPSVNDDLSVGARMWGCTAHACTHACTPALALVFARLGLCVSGGVSACLGLGMRCVRECGCVRECVGMGARLVVDHLGCVWLQLGGGSVGVCV